MGGVRNWKKPIRRKESAFDSTNPCMLKQSVFMDVMVKRSVRANRIPAVHSPLIPTLLQLGQRDSGGAPNDFEPTRRQHGGFWEMPIATARLFLFSAGLALSAQAGVREVGPIG